MTADRCDCCDLPVESCGKAAEQLARRQQLLDRQAALRKPGATVAQYPGVCGECGESFDKGEPIAARSAPGHRQPIDRSGASAWRGLLCCGAQS